MTDWSNLRARVAGKWQFPLFVLSLFLLVGSLWRVTPGHRPRSIEETDRVLDQLISAGLHDQAIGLAENMITEEPESRTKNDLAHVHRQLARAYFEQALRNGPRSANRGARIANHYDQAASGGLPLTADDYRRLGWANEWQKEYGSAVEFFGKALAGGVDQASDLRRHSIDLRRRYLGASVDELGESLDAFLASVEPHRHDLKFWAIEQKLELLEVAGRLEFASTMLVRYEADFESTDFRNNFAYLKAWTLYRTGHYDEAERFLRTIRNRLSPSDEVHAMTGWLLGRVVLGDGGPQRPLEAMSFFTDVIVSHSESPYALASRVGQAEAFYYMDRPDDAVSTFEIAFDDMPRLRANPLVDLGVLLTSLSVMAGDQRRAGHLAESLAYARLAKVLAEENPGAEGLLVLEQFVQTLEARAEGLSRTESGASPSMLDDDWTMSPSGAARLLYEEAAEVALDLARRSALKEERAAAWTWRAAEFLARAGQRQRAVDLYGSFSSERPAHALVPRALLRTGQLLQAMGRLPEAIESYQRCYRRFPRTLEGARTLVPLAECYLALGPGNESLAETTLRIVTDTSEVFTPQAPEFADAMFLLGDVLTRVNEFERAIAVMEEALERFGNDSRVGRTRFLLADAYRRSALALKLESLDASFAGEIQQMQTEAAWRFRHARDLYRWMIDEYESRGPESLGRLERVYYRHAALYEADCYFETQEYRPALKRYEEAVAIFKDSPTGLAAYVQIINCHVFLGRPHEARAALARAEILVDSMSDAAFEESVSPERREDWKRYLEWLNESELF